MAKYIRIEDIRNSQLEYMTNMNEITMRERIAELELERAIWRLRLQQAMDYYDLDEKDDEFWFSD